MPNCTTIGRSRPRPARICSICSALAASPAMIAAGSPGVRRSSANTSTATMSSTGIVESSLLAMKLYIRKRPLAGPRVRATASAARRLLHVPIDIARADDPAGHVLARGEGVDVFAQGRVRADLERSRLDRLRKGLLLRFLRRAREVVAQLFEARVGRPAEPGLLA